MDLRYLFLLLSVCVLQSGCDDIRGSGHQEQDGVAVDLAFDNHTLVSPRTAGGSNVSEVPQSRSHISVCAGIRCNSGLRCGSYKPNFRFREVRPFCFDPVHYFYDPKTCMTGVCGKKRCSSFGCVCPPSTGGAACDVLSDPCLDTSCYLSGRVCIALVGDHRCAFRVAIGDINSRPVAVGGVLPIVPRASVCGRISCPSGSLCEPFPLTEQTIYPSCIDRSGSTACTATSCNSGTCNSNTGRCACPTGRFGINCEITSTPCSSTSICSDDSICVTLQNGHMCMTIPTSLPPVTSTTTTTITTTTSLGPLDACSTNLCSSASAASCRCVPSCKHEFGYYCLSSAGYIGQRCEIAPPRIFCNDDSIRIEVSAAFLREYGDDLLNTFLYASPTVDGPRSTDRSCRAVSVGGVYVVTIPTFSVCGNTIRSTLNSEVVYENSLWLNSRHSALYDLPRPVLNFFCTYQKEYSVTAALKPVIDTPSAQISALLQGEISIALCKVSTCERSCPANLMVNSGAIYTVSEMLHLSVTVATTSLNDPSLQAELMDSYLSCSIRRTDTDHVVLKEGCQDGRQLDARVGRRDDNTICMSFRVPRMLTCTEVYIHVRMSLCAKQQFETRACQDGSSYRVCENIQKRSVGEDDSANIAYRVVGPITISHLIKGVGTFSYNTDDGDVEIIPDTPEIAPSASTSNLNNFFLLALAFCAILLVLALTIFVVSYLRRQRLQKSVSTEA